MSLLKQIHRRISDPGQFLPREPRGPVCVEPIEQWSARAVLQLFGRATTLLQEAADKLDDLAGDDQDPLANRIKQAIAEGFPDRTLRFHLGGRVVNGENQVWLDHKGLLPNRSQALRNHSPDGFAWGYRGSGPSQLALAILLELTQDPEWSLAHYQKLMDDRIAIQPAHQEFHHDIVWTP